MAKKNTKETGKKEKPKKGKKSETRRDPKKDSRAVKIEVESTGEIVKKEKETEIVFAGPFSGNPSLIQSNFGIKGNFELISWHFYLLVFQRLVVLVAPPWLSPVKAADS